MGPLDNEDFDTDWFFLCQPQLGRGVKKRERIRNHQPRAGRRTGSVLR